MTTNAPQKHALTPAPLGARASVTEAFWSDPVRFRLEFTNDVKTKELRWVLFTGPLSLSAFPICSVWC